MVSLLVERPAGENRSGRYPARSFGGAQQRQEKQHRADQGQRQEGSCRLQQYVPVRMAWLSSTKWVVGAISMIFLHEISGMLRACRSETSEAA